MTSLARRGVPFHRNPSLRPGLAALVSWLMENDYTSHAVGRIFDFVAVNGTPTGCPDLEPGDEAPATQVFCDGLDAVPYSSAAWDDPSVFLDAEMLAAGTHPSPVAPVRGGSIEAEPFVAPATFTPTPTEWAAACAMFRGDAPPAPAAAAGAPTDDELAEYIPTDADLAEMQAHFDGVYAPFYGYE